MANAALVKPNVTTAVSCGAANVHHQLQSNSSSSSCSFLPPLPSRRGSVSKRLVARAAINSTGFWTPEAAVPNYDIWSIRNDLEVPTSGFLGEGARAQGGQGPPPMLAERFQSVITQLFQQRIIRCGGAVDDDMANLIVAQLLYLDAADPNRDIVMYVNSPGGSVTAGMAIFDTMRHIRPDVSTVCVGLAARYVFLPRILALDVKLDVKSLCTFLIFLWN